MAITPLLYSNNADIKYPLSDFHEEDIPNSILLDLSLSVPEGIVPVLATVRIGVNFVFISLENADDRTPVATVIVTTPVTARVYPLTMDIPGHGWVVFGPRVVDGEPFYTGNIEVDLDPEVVIALKQVAPRIVLDVNGFRKTTENVLSLISNSIFLTVSYQGDRIFIDRQDDVLSDDDLIALNLEQDATGEERNQLLFTIDGTLPDEQGNIDIDILGCVEDCGDVRTLTIPRGDLAQGEQGELPLDIFAESQRFIPGDPCEPSDGEGSDASEEPDPFDGCTEIAKVTIIDAGDGDRPIGTLYTAEEAIL